MFSIYLKQIISSGSNPFSTAHFTANAFKVLCFVWDTLFLLAFRTQAGGGALFFCASYMTCICHLLLIPWSFSTLLFLSYYPVTEILRVFSCGQCYISNSQSLRYIALLFHFEGCLFITILLFIKFFHFFIIVINIIIIITIIIIIIS